MDNLNPLPQLFNAEALQAYIRAEVQAHISASQPTEPEPIEVDKAGLDKLFPGVFPDSTMYKLTAKKEIPFRKIGAKNVFNVQEIREWINSKRVTDKREVTSQVLTKDFINRRRKA